MTEHYRGSCPYRANLGCLDGVDPFELEAEVFDGRGLPTIND